MSFNGHNLGLATVRGFDSEFVGHGLVFGKFMPPTNGHLFLLNFARRSCRRLTILVCSLPDEPIPGEIRYQWVRELYPDCNVIHHSVVIPQEPGKDPNFFTIWRDSILRHCPGEKFDAMFASEGYGYKMAAVMGIQFIPVNTERGLVPISGTEMRENPMKHWEHLNPVVRPYFVRRVAVLGPDPAARATVANGLGTRFHTMVAGDYAELLLGDYARNVPAYDRDSMVGLADFSTIARGQMAAEDALARQANRVLISNTDLITTTLRAKELLGEAPHWLEACIAERPYHLHLLLHPGAAAPKEARDMFGKLQLELLSRQRPFLEISADKGDLLGQAIGHVQKLID